MKTIIASLILFSTTLFADSYTCQQTATLTYENCQLSWGTYLYYGNSSSQACPATVNRYYKSPHYLIQAGSPATAQEYCLKDYEAVFQANAYVSDACTVITPPYGSLKVGAYCNLRPHPEVTCNCTLNAVNPMGPIVVAPVATPSTLTPLTPVAATLSTF